MRPLTCDLADLLLAAYATGGVGPDEHRALRRHLVGCAPCRASGAAYVRATDLLPLVVDEVEPPAALRSRILAAVHGEVTGAPQPRPEGVLRRLWQRIPSGRSLTLGGAFGTALATGVAVLALATHTGNPANSTPSAASAAVVVTHACGLTADPSACGTLRYDRAAKQATLTMTGLSQIPVVAGQSQGIYELWLVRPNHSTVAAAFLTESPDGSTWSAVIEGDISSYVSLAMTREPAGGSPVPSGTELLRVDLSS